MSLSSQINTRPASIQKLVVPSGVNIASGVPSLTPTAGSLAQDVANPGLLFIGDGNNWQITGGGGGPDMPSSYQSGITMTALGGSPSLTGVTFYAQAIIAPDNNNKMMVMFSCQNLGSSAGAHQPETWTSTAPVIPSNFRPITAGQVFPLWCTQNTTQQALVSFSVLTSGAISLTVASSGADVNTNFSNVSGNYLVY